MSLRTLYDEASLWMTPGGYEDGKLFSELPTDGSGDFTFSRGSNLAATRVDVNGLIEKGRENLLLQSNTFSNAVWAGASTTETSGQSGYDGTNNAWLLEKLVANGNISQSVSASNLLTYSVYAKAGTRDWLRLNIVGVANAYFDLANGVVGSTGGAATITSAMVDAGGGWYRCSFTYNVASTTGVSIYVADADNDSSGTSGNIYIQDAQLELSLAATDYIESGATTGKAGLLEQEPRLDYSGGATCPALLLEPQRTNLIDYSEYFETYNKTRVAFVHNATASPEGLINAAEFNDTATSGTHFVQLRNGVAGGGVMSFFAKQNTHRYVQAGPSSSISKRVFFDLQDGVMATIGGSAESYYGIEDYGNGWYRCYVAFGDLESPSIFTAAGDGSSFNDNNYTGDGSGVYIYGTQVEQNVSYQTSYIPTHGSSVTRNFDNATTTSEEDVLTSGEGIVFMEFEINDTTITGYPEVIRIENPSDTTDKFWFYIFDDSDVGEIRFGYRLDDTAVKKVEGSVTLDAMTTAKVAMRLENNNYALYYNGTKQTPTQYAGVVSNLRKITTRGREHFNGLRVKQFAIFNEALSDSELATLTTL